MAKNISKNSLKNKVIINIGTSSRGTKRKIKSNTSKSISSKSSNVNPPPPNIIYNTVNPSVDPFGLRNQIQAQNLQTISQLKLNDDIVRSLRSDIAIAQNNIASLRDVRFEPFQRPLFISPELNQQERVSETYINLPPINETEGKQESRDASFSFGKEASSSSSSKDRLTEEQIRTLTRELLRNYAIQTLGLKLKHNISKESLINLILRNN